MAPKLRPYWADDTQRLLPKNQRRLADRSELAKKYGHPIGNCGYLSQRVLKNTGKSGATPVDSGHAAGDINLQKVLDSYQKRRFFGFSTLELDALQAMTALQTQKMNDTLNNPVMPLFDRSRWERDGDMPTNLGPVPIRGDHEGEYWLAENPTVWKLMEPSLKLASLFIENAAFFPWWDALINGDLVEIPDVRDPRADKTIPLLNFNYRSPSVSQTRNSYRNIENRFNDLRDVIIFRLISGYSSTNIGLPGYPDAQAGFTSLDIGTEYIILSMGIELLQPLLDDSLTPAERIGVQFRFAATLIHEIAHAVWYYNIPFLDADSRSGFEPYFGDEVLAELGWSLEDKIFGGEGLDIFHSSYLQGGPGVPQMALVKTNWFTNRHVDYFSGPIPLLEYVVPLPDGVPDPFYCNDFWPIPTSWTHGLFKEDMWQMLVKGFGVAATQMGPCAIGTRVWHDDPFDSPTQYLYGTDMNASFAPYYHTNSTPIQHFQYMSELRRRSHASVIAIRIMAVNNLSSYQLVSIPDDDEDTVPSIDRHDHRDFSCPRWHEITAYLFANRGPLELALESMNFDIPEPTLYEYIHARRGISLTHAEFRQFLYAADNRKILFAYLPFPSTGTVRRLPYGWPAPYIPPPIPPMANVRNVDNYTAVDVVLNDVRMHDELYNAYGEFRDMDMQVLRLIVNGHLGEADQVDEDAWVLIMNQMAIESKLLTWGPKGVVRLLFPTTDEQRKKWKQPFEAVIEEEFNEKEREAKDANDKSNIAQSSQAGGDASLQNLGRLNLGSP